MFPYLKAKRTRHPIEYFWKFVQRVMQRNNEKIQAEMENFWC